MHRLIRLAVALLLGWAVALTPGPLGTANAHQNPHVLLHAHGVGSHSWPYFTVDHAPWTVSWRFDCSGVAPGHRHTVLHVAQNNLVLSLVVSNGASESAISLHGHRTQVQVDRAVRSSWRHGTAGTLTETRTGRFFAIPLYTRCRWQVKVDEPSPTPHAGASPLLGRHSCVRGRTGMSWHVTHSHRTYADIIVDEPDIAFLFHGTIRRLPGTKLMLIAAQTFYGTPSIPLEYIYAAVYWPENRPRPQWLRPLSSPNLRSGISRKIACQR